MRCYHWRKRHRKEHNDRSREWRQEHPERSKQIQDKWAKNNKEQRRASLNDWRARNPGKRQAQNKRARKRRRSRLRYRRYHYEVRFGIVVAVTCIICGDLVLGQRWGEKLYCKNCKKKVDRKVPHSVIMELANHPSFSEMPYDLKAWKTIMELRRIESKK